MRRVTIIILICFACLLWLGLRSSNPGARGVRARASPEADTPRHRIPESAPRTVKRHGVGPVQANRMQRAVGRSAFLPNALGEQEVDLETPRVDLRQEQASISPEDHARFEGRRPNGSGRQAAIRQRCPRPEEESLLSLVLHCSKIALTWGLEAALIHELAALRLCI
ncbi:MAG: hypothetical protein HXY20_10955 [Acidobacteria bacterium]|nr:hypothetical protein [Acidobacteriota bacterium]